MSSYSSQAPKKEFESFLFFMASKNVSVSVCKCVYLITMVTIERSFKGSFALLCDVIRNVTRDVTRELAYWQRLKAEGYLLPDFGRDGQLDDMSEMDKPSTEALIAQALRRKERRKQRRDIIYAAEELNTDITNMSVDPDGELFPEQIVLQESTPTLPTPHNTEEKEQESQASTEDLLHQNQELREQLKRQQEESQAFQKDMLKVLWGLRARHQAQCEEWMENTLNEHKKELEAKDAEISNLKKEKSSAFDAQVEGARRAVKDELEELYNIEYDLKKMVTQRESKCQGLLNIITRKTHQMKALQQNLRKEREKKKVLKNQLTQLQSSVDQKEQATAALTEALDKEKCSSRELKSIESSLTSALTEQSSTIREAQNIITRKTHQIKALQQNLREERKEKKALTSQLTQLQSSLDQKEQASAALTEALAQEKFSSRELQSQVEQQEREREELKNKVSFLTSALTEQSSTIREAQSKVQTLQDKKVRLESVVKELSCRVTEQEEMIQEQQASAQTLNQDLQTEKFTSKVVIEKCHAAYASALAQITNLTRRVKDSSRENENLKDIQKKELRAEEQRRLVLEQKIEELSETLTTSQESNSALKQQNQELLVALELQEEELQEKKRRKRWWFFRRT